MIPLEQTTPEQLQAFATSLAIGLLIGLERERRPDTKAGLRTFALVSLLGTLAGLIATRAGSGWVVAVGLFVVGAMMIAAVNIDPHDDGDPGTTSVVAMLVCYGLGAAVWYGYGELAVMLAIATTMLLYFKAQLHGISASLTHRDLISILQFAVLSFIVLPILPDRNYGPYGTLNPHQAWWMVVLISGVSLAGYAALRIAGSRAGATMIGLLGGFASSTATTLVFSRHARERDTLVPTAAVVILLANLVVMLRLLLVSAAVAPALVLQLSLVLGAGLAAGLAITLYSWRRLSAAADLPMPEVKNPTEIRTAVSFGLLYAVVLFLSAWLQDIAGNKGLYLVALASGLTDVDAITLSSLRLFNLDKLAAEQTVIAIALAILANLAFKTGLVVALGGLSLARHVLPGMLAITAGLGAGLFAL